MRPSFSIPPYLYLGGKEPAEEESTDETAGVNGVLAPQTIIPPILEQYLERIAKTGEPNGTHTWD